VATANRRQSDRRLFNGKPEDVAAMVAYLVSPDAHFVTSQNVDKLLDAIRQFYPSRDVGLSRLSRGFREQSGVIGNE